MHKNHTGPPPQPVVSHSTHARAHTHKHSLYLSLITLLPSVTQFKETNA
jgi:hypothetical protein